MVHIHVGEWKRYCTCATLMQYLYALCSPSDTTLDICSVHMYSENNSIFPPGIYGDGCVWEGIINHSRAFELRFLPV